MCRYATIPSPRIFSPPRHHHGVVFSIAGACPRFATSRTLDGAGHGFCLSTLRSSAILTAYCPRDEPRAGLGSHLLRDSPFPASGMHGRHRRCCLFSTARTVSEATPDRRHSNGDATTVLWSQRQRLSWLPETGIANTEGRVYVFACVLHDSVRQPTFRPGGTDGAGS